MRTSAVRLTWIAVILTLLVCMMVALHAVPFGLPSVWTWQYIPLGQPWRVVWPCLAGCVLFVIFRGPLQRLIKPSPEKPVDYGALLSLWFGSLLLSLGVTMMHPSGLVQLATLVINPASNSYFSTALTQPDLRDMVNDYHQKMPNFTSHAQTQAAGPVVLHGLLRQFFLRLPGLEDAADTLFALSSGVSSEYVRRSAGQWWHVTLTTADVSAALFVALTLVGVGALAVVPLYFAGRSLHGPEAGALAAAAFVLLPGFHSFSPSVDQLYPLVTAVALCLSIRSMQAQRGWIWASALGIWLGLAVFMNMGLIVLAPLCILFIGLLVLRDAPHEGRILLVAKFVGAFSIGLLAVWLALRLFFGYDVLAVYHASDALRLSLYNQSRSYSWSLPANLIDFLVFAGVPVAVFCVAAGLRAVCRLPRGFARDGVKFLRTTRMEALGWAFALVLLALDFSGKTRGEVGRMWMFLMPCLLLIAAGHLSALRATGACTLARCGLALAVAQWGQVVVFQYSVRVWGY